MDLARRLITNDEQHHKEHSEGGAFSVNSNRNEAFTVSEAKAFKPVTNR